MLDTMREGSKGFAAKAILIVIILSFALAGVSSYLGGSNTVVAVEVNGSEISQASVDQAYKSERARLQKEYGEQFELLAASPNFQSQIKAQVTQNLISEMLISQAIEEMGLRVGDEQVKREIRAMKEFQIDGKFNNDQYLSVLRRASYSPAMFSQSIKQDATRRQLLQMLVGSEFVTPLEVSAADKLQAQKRIAQLLTVNVADFSKNDAVSKDEIKAYYDANNAFFQTPEQVSVDYILIDSDKLSKAIKVTDADVETYYDHNSESFKRPEQRHVAHILIQGDSAKSKAKAEAILAKLKKGADFATMAKEKSDDTFSGKKGGTLNWIEQGVMDPAFDKVAFSLKKANALSEVVKSKFGYHIIKLIEIKKATIRPLSDVKQQVIASIKKEKVSEHYYDLQQRLGETAFESPDSLDEAAGAVEMKIQHADFFGEHNAPQVLANKAVLRTLFDVDFRDQGMNSEIIELSDTTSIVVRVNEYKAPSSKALAEVSAQIALQLKSAAARKNTQEYAASLLAKLDKNEDIKPLLAGHKFAFSGESEFSRFSQTADPQVLQTLFKLAKPQQKMASYGLTVKGNGDVVIVKLSKVIDETKASEPQMTQQIESVLQRSTADATYRALVEVLMDNADIKYMEAK